MKSLAFPENALVPWAAKMLGRPVKWTSDRQEAFLSDSQGREANVHAELALDDNARFLAVRAESFANVGAYLSSFSLMIPTMAGFRLLTGAYRIPAAYGSNYRRLAEVKAKYDPDNLFSANRNIRPEAHISSSDSSTPRRARRARPGRDPSPQRAAASDAHRRR
jgi:hypothetical protein